MKPPFGIPVSPPFYPESDPLDLNTLGMSNDEYTKWVMAGRPQIQPERPMTKAAPFTPGGMSTGAPEDFNPLTGPMPPAPPAPPPPVPAAGPAASIAPPAAPGRIVRGPNGEIMGTNLADDRKTLALGGDFRNNTSDANSLRAEVAKSGPMRFSSDTGHTATLTPGGIGGYTYGGDLPSMGLTAQQVMDDKNLNPGQQAGWMDRKNEEFEMAMKQAAIDKLKGEAFGAQAQGGLFEEETAGRKQTRTMTPEESAYRGSSIPLEQWVMQNEDKLAVIIGPLVDAHYVNLLSDPRNMKLAKDPAFRLQLRQRAKTEVIQQYVKENQPRLLQALMGSGSYMPPTS